MIRPTVPNGPPRFRFSVSSSTLVLSLYRLRQLCTTDNEVIATTTKNAAEKKNRGTSWMQREIEKPAQEPRASGLWKSREKKKIPRCAPSSCVSNGRSRALLQFSTSFRSVPVRRMWLCVCAVYVFVVAVALAASFSIRIQGFAKHGYAAVQSDTTRNVRRVSICDVSTRN